MRSSSPPLSVNETNPDGVRFETFVPGPLMIVVLPAWLLMKLFAPVPPMSTSVPPPPLRVVLPVNAEASSVLLFVPPVRIADSMLESESVPSPVNTELVSV